MAFNASVVPKDPKVREKFHAEARPKAPKKKSANAPVFVKTCEAGKNYVLPNVGVARCVGEKVVQVSGVPDFTVVCFEEITQSKIQGARQVPLSKISTAKIRDLLSEQELDEIIAGFDSKTKPKIKKPQAGYKKEDFLSGILSENDLKKTAVLARSIYSDFLKLKYLPPYGIGATQNFFAEKAVHLLAMEYSIVKGLDYGTVKSYIFSKIGKDAVAARMSQGGPKNDL